MIERLRKFTPKKEVTFTTIRRFIFGGPQGVRRTAVRDWLAIQWAQACESRAIMLGDSEGVRVARQIIKGIDAEMRKNEGHEDNGAWYMDAYREFELDYFPHFLREASRAVPASEHGIFFTEAERRIWAANRVVQMYPGLAAND